MTKQILFICLIVCGWLNTMTLFAQEAIPTQTIRGLVIDAASAAPLSSASVKIINAEGQTTVTNTQGQFVLPDIPVGRYDLQVSFMGYETSISYRINCKNTSHEFALKGLNATNYREYSGHAYNLKTCTIEPRRLKTTVLNLLYRIDF